MSDAAQRPWLVSATTGRIVSYGDLLGKLREVRTRKRNWLRPAGTEAALVGIARALVEDGEIALVDSDLTDAQVERLGLFRGATGDVFSEGVSAELDERLLRKKAAGESRARIGLTTSGSSGSPRLVWQTAGNLARGVRISPRHGRAVWGLAFRPTHIGGVHVFLQALANGCAMVDLQGLSPAQVVAAVEKFGVTHLSATPSFFRQLVGLRFRCENVLSVTAGGETVAREMIDGLARLFPAARVRNIYASTEAGTLLVSDGETFSIPPALRRQLEIRDGRLWVRREMVGEIAGAESSEEWFDTGDLVEFVGAESHAFRIAGRESDWVNVGGDKVNPREVEAVLEAFPGVRQARVFSRSNSVTGQLLCAELACEGPPPEERAVRVYAEARLQGHKVPRLLRFVTRIEQTWSGKVSRG
ncbi:MAG: Triostin synthetase [Verrucomicrobiota bacterium]|jgi:acyl-CoA synthetase (AMP-forming)/AMP-acid ligase II